MLWGEAGAQNIAGTGTPTSTYGLRSEGRYMPSLRGMAAFRKKSFLTKGWGTGSLGVHMFPSPARHSLPESALGRPCRARKSLCDLGQVLP